MSQIGLFKKGNLTLKVFENKQGLRGTLYEDKKKVNSAMFYEKDRENTIYRVKEYYHF